MYQQYTTMETALILNISFTIPENHEARLMSRFVDSIPESVLMEDTSHTGRPAFHPAMLLKMFLFAYSRGVTSGRKIEQLNAESIPMKWLTADTSVSYRTLNSFRASEHANDLIKMAFILFTFMLRDNDLIESDALFIDGTKLQADANIYSFTWKKSVERYDAKLNDHLSELYDTLIQEKVNLALINEAPTDSAEIRQMIRAIDDELDVVEAEIEAEERPPKGRSLHKKRRRTLKKHRRKLAKDYLPRKEKYETAQATFDGRNSFSKTDPDATFMCMKEDPMKNRELKPGYNLQVASSNQYVIDFDIFPNPTDTRTLIPFLESIQTLDLFQTIVADSGYGREQNYEAIIDDFEKESLIPYTMYYREQTKQYKTNPKNRNNWNYDEESDYYTDLDGVRFSFSHYSQRTDKQGYVRDFKVYVADKDQLDERLNELAKTPKGRQRQTSVNQTWEFFKQQTREALASDEGKTLYGKRKTDIETVFGRLKTVFGMRRAHVRGKQAVYTDIGFMLMSMNLTKLALEARKRSQTQHNNTHQNGNNRAKIHIQILTRLFSFLGAEIGRAHV